MAITRGQMQRQLRQNGGIMDVTSGTIGGGDYAGIPMGSRTGFGILKKIKKRVRKIIPNEIADIAVKAAPFVAPFNPIVAGAMAGIGSLDQTGNVADAFKRGALTFGGGQLARVIGGAGFQDPSLSAFTPSGFRAGFSSPLGTKTGLGKFLDQRNQQAAAKSIAEQAKANELAYQKASGLSEIGGVGGEQFVTADAATDFVSKVKNPNPVKGDTNFIGELFGNIKNKDYPAVGDQLLEGTKSIGKAIFLDDKGNIDKSAVLATISMATSYKEAKEIADSAGVDVTEEEYDNLKKDEKKEEYAGYLQNFFGGKKDGGRIGFARGTDLNESDEIEEFKKLISGEIIENEDPDMKDMDDLMAGGGISFTKQEKSYLFRRLGGSGGRERSYTMPQLYRILSSPNSYPNDAAILKQIAVVGLGGKKDGGRIELGTGSRPSQLFKLLEEAEAAGDMDKVKEIKSDLFKEFGLKLAKGGRINFKKGSDKNLIGLETLKLGEYDAEGFKNKTDYNTLILGSDDLKELSKSLESGVLSNLSKRQKEKIREKILLARAGIDSDLTEYGQELGFTLNEKQKNFLETILPDKIMRKIMEDDEGDARIGIQKANQLLENIAFGGQRDPGMPSRFYNKLGDEYIEKQKEAIQDRIDFNQKEGRRNFLNFKMGGEVPVRKNKAGIEELDYRESGGFVPVGVKERADDVPAMLSKNEFVMTADAVRGIGNGDVEKGAQKLYNVMKQAEKVGKA